VNAQAHSRRFRTFVSAFHEDLFNVTKSPSSQIDIRQLFLCDPALRQYQIWVRNAIERMKPSAPTSTPSDSLADSKEAEAPPASESSQSMGDTAFTTFPSAAQTADTAAERHLDPTGIPVTLQEFERALDRLLVLTQVLQEEHTRMVYGLPVVPRVLLASLLKFWRVMCGGRKNKIARLQRRGMISYDLLWVISAKGRLCQVVHENTGEPVSRTGPTSNS
jgi:hypothetical protein